MQKEFLLFLTISAIAASPLQATEITNALNAKKICELANGYIQATPGNEDEMGLLVADVNTKRARVYADIAAKERLDPATVATESARQEKAVHPEKFCP